MVGEKAYFLMFPSFVSIRLFPFYILHRYNKVYGKET